MTTENTEILENEIIEASENLKQLISEIHKKVVGQDELIKSLIIGLLSHGHILLEGVPGLAKTLTISTLSETLDLGFNRIQFTPDLLPSDLIGTEIFNLKTGDFLVKKGPIFNNFILADEINRAPSKVHSALLEAMGERQITIGNESFKLDEPFIVLATQNPIEEGGTYNLPEAGLDRFLLKTIIDYPTKQEEIEMLKRKSSQEKIKINKILNKTKIKKLQKLVKEIFVSDNIFEYVADLVGASRKPENYGLEELKEYINYGISPRGSEALINSAKVIALLDSRSFIIPEDIKEVFFQVSNHRIGLSYEALANDIDLNYVINKIINNIKIK